MGRVLVNAKKCADQNPGYKVFDADGKVVDRAGIHGEVIKIRLMEIMVVSVSRFF